MVRQWRLPGDETVGDGDRDCRLHACGAHHSRLPDVAAKLSKFGAEIGLVNAAYTADAPPIRIGALPTVSTQIMPRAMKLFLAEGTGATIKIAYAPVIRCCPKERSFPGSMLIRC